MKLKIKSFTNEQSLKDFSRLSIIAGCIIQLSETCSGPALTLLTKAKYEIASASSLWPFKGDMDHTIRVLHQKMEGFEQEAFPAEGVRFQTLLNFAIIVAEDFYKEHRSLRRPFLLRTVNYLYKALLIYCGVDYRSCKEADQKAKLYYTRIGI